MNVQITELINKYLDTIAVCVSKLEKEYGRNDLLTAYREKEIPKEASINGVNFEFHGVGCYFEHQEIECDMDFGPRNRTDGFDAWRLSKFAKQFKEFNCYADENTVQNELTALEMLGKIKKFNEPPKENLYYLV